MPQKGATKFDNLAPNFMLKVNGQEVDENVNGIIQQVETEQEVGLVDSVKLTVANINLRDQFKPGGPSGLESAERVSDLKLFAEGNDLEVWMGYGEKLEFIAKGQIMRWLPTFPRTGIPTFEVIALGEAHKMMDPVPPKRESTKQWRSMKYDEIVKFICGSYGFETSDVALPTVKTPKNGVPIQNETSDWDFIKSLAQLNAYEFYITFDPDIKKEKVVWGPPKPNQKATFNLFYDNGDKTTLMEFNPEFNLSGQSSVIEVIGWDRKAGQPIIFRIENTKTGEKKKWAGKDATSSIVDQIEAGEVVSLTEFGKATRVLSSSAITTEADAKAHADRILATSRYAFFQGIGVLVGLEVVKPRQIHNLKGVGFRFSGRYYFQGVRHIMSQANYETAFSARLVSDAILS